MRNFYVRTHVNFTRVNKIETMHVRSRVNVKVERRSTFTFMGGLYFIYALKFSCVCTEKLRDSGNQPQGTFVKSEW